MTAHEQFLQPIQYSPSDRQNMMDEIFAPSNYASFIQSLRMEREQNELSTRNFLAQGINFDDDLKLISPENNQQKYTVKEGDSLWNIVTEVLNEKSGEEPAAWKTLETLRKIAEKNHLANPDLIHPGEVIDFSVLTDEDFAQQNTADGTQVSQQANSDGQETSNEASSANSNTVDGAATVPLRNDIESESTIKTPSGPTTANSTVERDRWYISQAGNGSNWYACGPTSLTMALAAYGIAPATESNRQKLIRETGTNPNIGFPGTSEKMAAEAQKRGLNAESRATTDWREVDEQLAKGRSVIVNGTMVGKNGGLIKHFVFIAGKDSAGNYILGDPAQSKDTWTIGDLKGFLTRGGEPNGYAAVWR